MQRTILVVEDEPILRDTIVYNLRAEGYDVLTAGDGATALDTAQRSRPDLVLLDVMLPVLDGLEVCRQLRQRGETTDVPILMLTARADETDKVVGLELGADDHVTKPFSGRELRARVRALLRRAEPRPAATPAASLRDESRILTAEDLRVDLDRREVLKGERQIEMPARLFDLLVYLLRHRGMVLTRDRLLEHVWGYDFAGDTRTVDVHIRWLREKVEEDPANPVLVQTVRGWLSLQRVRGWLFCGLPFGVHMPCQRTAVCGTRRTVFVVAHQRSKRNYQLNGRVARSGIGNAEFGREGTYAGALSLYPQLISLANGRGSPASAWRRALSGFQRRHPSSQRPFPGYPDNGGDWH